MDHLPVPEGKDPQLWETARKRIAFKKHLAIYLVVNLFLWVIWYFTDGSRDGVIPWPAWSLFGWGISLVFQYLGAYASSGTGAVEKEYEQLVQNQLKK